MKILPRCRSSYEQLQLLLLVIKDTEMYQENYKADLYGPFCLSEYSSLYIKDEYENIVFNLSIRPKNSWFEYAINNYSEIKPLPRNKGEFLDFVRENIEKNKINNIFYSLSEKEKTLLYQKIRYERVKEDIAWILQDEYKVFDPKKVDEIARIFVYNIPENNMSYDDNIRHIIRKIG